MKEKLDRTHVEGELKAEVVADPKRYVDLDPEAPLALLDQKHAGKKLLLITNSEWPYTNAIMTYAFERFLEKGMRWRELFDLVVVSARKPAFFTTPSPFFEIINEEGLLRPATTRHLVKGGAYLGGSAREIEQTLGLAGEEILYVGDHMFGDVHVTKNVLRWRTALVLRELEDEISAAEKFRATEETLAVLMARKEELEAVFCHLKLEQQRARGKYVPAAAAQAAGLAATSTAGTSGPLEAIRGEIRELDEKIAPLVVASRGQNNPLWGLLMRAGADKSHLAYQMERYADIYTSRVSNLMHATPYVYLRSPRGSLPHDPSPAPGHPGEA